MQWHFTTAVTVQLEIKTAEKAKHKVGNAGIPEEENTKIKLEIKQCRKKKKLMEE
jgi:hypothetical protein